MSKPAAKPAAPEKSTEPKAAKPAAQLVDNKDAPVPEELQSRGPKRIELRKGVTRIDY